MIIILGLIPAAFEDLWTNDDFDKLWEQVVEQENKFPQTAYDLVESIYRKALKEERDDQLIKAIMYKARLSRSIKDEDSAQEILDMEKEMSLLKSEAGRSVYASLLGQLYHNYGLRNAYRFQNRTQIGDKETVDPGLAFSSLEYIQTKAAQYYIQSIDISSDISLDNVETLLENVEDGTSFLKVNNLEQFLHLRAIQHFVQSNAFVGLPSGHLKYNGPEYFEKNLHESTAFSPTASDFSDVNKMVLWIFAKTLNDTNLDDRQRIWLKTQWINHVFLNAGFHHKVEAYISALHDLINSNVSKKGIEYPTLKLINFYISQVSHSSADAAKEPYWQKASLLVEALKKNEHDSYYNKFIDQAESKITQKEYNLKLEHVVQPGLPFLSYVQYRNTPELIYTIHPLSSDERDKLSRNFDYKDRLNTVGGIKEIRSGIFKMDKSEDHNWHTKEFALDALEFGSYCIMVRDAEDAERYSMSIFHVSNLSYVSLDNKDASEIFITDRTTGQPLSDIRTEVYELGKRSRSNKREWELKEALFSDENGRVQYEGNSRNFTFKLIHKDDVLDLREYHHVRGDFVSKQHNQVSLFTDRAIYRPGQTVYYKGLVMTYAGAGNQIPSIAASQEVKLVWKDANRQVISEQTFTSDAYGAFDGILKIPSSRLGGQYRIELHSNNRRSSHTIRVEEYKRPKLFVKIDSLSNSPILGDTILLSGQVNSYSGAKVSQAKVRYRVERVERQWYPRFSYPSRSTHNAENVISGMSNTDDNGQFSIEFPSKLATNNYIRYNYTAYVDITDETGETVSLVKTITLGSTPIYMDIQMVASRFADDPSKIAVVAKNADGAILNVDTEIIASRLDYPQSIKRNKRWEEAEFHQLDENTFYNRFPLDIYKSESDPSEWKVLDIVKSSSYSGNGVSTDDFGDLPLGVYKVDFTVKDNSGSESKDTRYLHISDRHSKALPTKELWVSSTEEFYQPGDKVVLKVTTPFDDAKIIYKVYQNRSTRTASWVTLDPSNQIEYIVSESDLGGLSIGIAMIKDNRFYTHNINIYVPWIEKALSIEYKTFRDKIEPGSKEKWQLSIKDSKGDPVTGRLSAALYDSSLDQFVKHNWQKDLYPKYKGYQSWRGIGFNIGQSYNYSPHIRLMAFSVNGHTPILNTFGLLGGRSHYTSHGGFPEGVMMDKSALAPRAARMASAVQADASGNQSIEESGQANDGIEADLNSQNPEDNLTDEFNIRENLNETVFFIADKEIIHGNVDLEFTMNEALTKWNLMLFAHDLNLAYTFDRKTVITQKKLMVEPFLPRFLRQSDQLVVTAKVSNLTEQAIQADCRIEFIDALSSQDITASLIENSPSNSVEIEAGESEIVSWSLNVPENHNSPIIIRQFASSDKHIDGEQSILPVVSNRILITESQPFFIPQEDSKDIEVSALRNLENSKTINTHKYSIQLTTNPAWLVVKSIPFLLTADSPSSLSTFYNLYGSVLMKHLISKEPHIRQVLRQWEGVELKSPLAKNRDFKLDDLNATPWVREALSEEEMMSLLSIYLDDNYVQNKLVEKMQDLKKYQVQNGGYSWMPGGIASWHTTNSILEGVGHLTKLDVELKFPANDLIQALNYIDEKFLEQRKIYRSKKNDKISPIVLHYLYARSFYTTYNISSEVKREMDEVFEELKDAWYDYSTYTQGLIAYSALRFGKRTIVSDIKKALLERLIRDEDVGYYLNDQAGYYWYNSDISKQALMIELFQDLGIESETISKMKLWLLRNKQSNRWKTQQGTSKACYAFLLGEEAMLIPNQETVIYLPKLSEEIKADDKELKSGYMRRDFDSEKISSDYAEIRIDNPSNTPVWGATYWQYYEDIAKVQAKSESPLSLSKSLHKVVNTKNGEEVSPIKSDEGIVPGDLIRVKLTISVDRPMEFVELKDWRGSGLEPLNVLSRFKRQDGLGYYETTKDLASIFYFSRLPKGNWVIEYDLRANHQGQFVNGLAQIQSVYAPEFGSYSNGSVINISQYPK